MRLFALGITKNKLADKTGVNTYRILLENKQISEDGKNRQYTYKLVNVAEESLINEINTTKYQLVNIGIENGKIVGRTGSLDRFNNGVNRPLVLLNEIRGAGNVLLGYRLANARGQVTNFTLAKTLSYCKKVNMDGGIPIQNAMYVPEKDGKSAFLRAYPGGDFEVEFVTVKKNEYSKPADIDKKKIDKTIKKSKLEDLFTQEQIAELKKAKAAGVDIRIIGNNKLSPEQMQVIWQTEQMGLRGRLFADPEYSLENMKFYSAELECKSDISQILNPKYTLEQIFEISLGIEEGLEVSKYANPKNKAVKMAKIRAELEKKTWKDFKVYNGSVEDLV